MKSASAKRRGAAADRTAGMAGSSGVRMAARSGDASGVAAEIAAIGAECAHRYPALAQFLH